MAVINISQEDFEGIKYYAKLYKREYDTIVHEALKLYFEAQKKAQAQTEINLDYDEFWDGVELD
ncbi:MAG: hypothetical protein KU28_08785 [Sulfurovum sp. PC08-66]|nr:MAG: hypothetical protein KU28_08785 [Sulfurovum sp. PC08-66]